VLRLRRPVPADRLSTPSKPVLRWSHVVAWVESDREWRPVTEVGFTTRSLLPACGARCAKTATPRPDLSRRTLEIPEEAATALRQHRKEKTMHRLTTGNA
jgi:hypothetical protein